MADIKKIGIGIGITLIAIVVLLQIAGQIIPDVATSGSKLTDDAMCVAQGCVTNATASAALPCRVNITGEFPCAQGQPALAGSSLYTGVGSVIFLLLGIGIFLLVMKLVFSKKN